MGPIPFWFRLFYFRRIEVDGWLLKMPITVKLIILYIYNMKIHFIIVILICYCVGDDIFHNSQTT
jgi:hypothetical protein